jgi:hypothetical protein
VVGGTSLSAIHGLRDNGASVHNENLVQNDRSKQDQKNLHESPHCVCDDGVEESAIRPTARQHDQTDQRGQQATSGFRAFHISRYLALGLPLLDHAREEGLDFLL